MNATRNLFLACILTLSIMSAYRQTLEAPFIFDDFANIAYNDFIKIEKISLESLTRVWQAPNPNHRRKLVHLSFALNYAWGGYDLRGFHLVNTGIHITNGLLTALLFFLIISQSRLEQRYGNGKLWLVWFSALLWSLHPIQINSVVYIVQRMNSMAVMFALLTLIAWLTGRAYWKKKQYFKCCISGVAGLFFWFAGLLCKEIVVIVPLLMAVTEFFLFREGRPRIQWRWAVSGAVILIFFAFYYYGPAPWNRLLYKYSLRDFSLAERLMTESRVLWHYISLFFFPLPDRFVFLHDYPLSESLLKPPTTVISMTALFFTISAAWIIRKKHPLVSWTVFWFFAAHLIESTVIPLEIIYEHRMYLPSTVLSFCCVVLAYDFLSGKNIHPKNLILSASVLFLALGISTYTRSLDFRDNITLYKSELEKYPDFERTRLNLALAYNRKGHFEEGGKILEEMTRQYPKDIVILQNWHNFTYRVRKDPVSADRIYRDIVHSIEEGNYNAQKDSLALWNLLRTLKEIEQYDEALYVVKQILKDYPYDSAWFYKGRLHADQNDWPSARTAFSRAHEMNPDDPPILFWYGKSLIRTGDKDKGCGIIQLSGQSRTNGRIVLMSRELLTAECGVTNADTSLNINPMLNKKEVTP